MDIKMVESEITLHITLSQQEFVTLLHHLGATAPYIGASPEACKIVHDFYKAWNGAGNGQNR